MLDRSTAQPDHGAFLDTLARADAAGLKALAEAILPSLGAVEVIQSRTGLVMLPMRDTVKGTDFHLGEVLVSEAHIRADGAEGYGMIVGRDLEQAMAMALVDAAGAAGLAGPDIAAFVQTEARRIAARDEARLRDVEATRVEMETF